jgi:hypothetical protein
MASLGWKGLRTAANSGSTCACMQFVHKVYAYKTVPADSRTLEIYHDSVFQKCITENRNPFSIQTTPSLQPNYAATEVTVDHNVVWQFLYHKIQNGFSNSSLNGLWY